MREWNLKANDLPTLTIAADARLCSTDYTNDQVWELSLKGGEPAGLTIQTTYGLRARSMKLFPRFIEDEQVHSDPASFAGPVIVHRFYPNYAEVAFAPFKGIEATAEYWAPASQVLAGSFSLSNSGETRRTLRMELAAVLNPCGEGQRMAPAEIELAPVLSGTTEGLYPVLFLTGGAHGGTGSYPALILSFDLQPGELRQVIWAIAAKENVEESFNLDRNTVARNWDAERARLEMVNASQIEIHTGDPDWDVAFAYAQKTAFSLVLSPTSLLPKSSFVCVREPDQGFSLRGDGRDYTQFWNGQSALDSYFLSTLLLPGAPDLVEGLIVNFLSTQQEDGAIDWKPGLGGQRNQLLATPLLASMAWNAYRATERRDFLERVFPSLLAFIKAWLSPKQDRDNDGVPEWSHVMQSGYDDNPLFTCWRPRSQGADISAAESPALCAFLFREIKSLIQMAQLLQQTDEIPALESAAEKLRTAIEVAWDEKNSTYQYWDRDSHFCTSRVELGTRQGPGDIQLLADYPQPVRLLVKVQTMQETTRRAQVFIHGVSPTGQHLVEHIPNERFFWYLGTGHATGERIYSRIERVEIQGLDLKDTITLFSVGYAGSDITLLLPLWAGIPAAERLKNFINKTITSPKGFWQPYGLPVSGEPANKSTEASGQEVNLEWNLLIGEGLVANGYRKEAAELVTRLMKAIIRSVKTDGGFRRYYHAQTGQGIGEKNALHGLAPVGLFLEALGVRLISPNKVVLNGANPFPWPVTVKYRGLTVFRQSGKTIVIFPGGQTVNVNKPEAQIISLESE
jgi:hypothetical protein